MTSGKEARSHRRLASSRGAGVAPVSMSRWWGLRTSLAEGPDMVFAAGKPTPSISLGSATGWDPYTPSEAVRQRDIERRKVVPPTGSNARVAPRDLADSRGLFHNLRGGVRRFAATGITIAALLVVRFLSLGLAIVLLVSSTVCGPDTDVGDPEKATEGTRDVSEVASASGIRAGDEDGAASAAPSPGAPSESERHDCHLMDRVRGDLRQGRDVVITSYVGLWYTQSNDPSRNSYWGALYGHGAMFRPARRSEIKRRREFLELTDHEILRDDRRSADPVIIEVIAAPTTIAPSEGSERSRIVVA